MGNFTLWPIYCREQTTRQAVTAAREGLGNGLRAVDTPQTLLTLPAKKKRRFPGRPTRSPVTVPNELSWLLLTICCYE
jgi:hypothetical protein